MGLEKQFACPLPNGVHARPASALEEVARRFVSDAIVVNQRSQRAADAKSILSIVSADIRHLDPCALSVSGADERDAMAALSEFIDNQFPLCDEPLGPETHLAVDVRLPPCLANAQATVYPGAPAAAGFAIGRVVRVGAFRVPFALAEAAVSDPHQEWRELVNALDQLDAAYERRLKEPGAGIALALLKTRRAIARDAEFRRRLQEATLIRRRSAAGSIAEAEAWFSRDLAATGSALLRDRALDIQDVSWELLRERYGGALEEEVIELTTDSIVVAESLTPGQFLALDRKFLKGLALSSGSAMSHTIILARSFGIPTLVRAQNLATLGAEEAVVDANLGVLLAPVTRNVSRYYKLESRRVSERRERLAALTKATGEAPLKVAANISTAEEAAAAFAAGADGIGLFRTEMLFMGRATPPGEDEQFEIYKTVVAAADGKPVVIRTLDVGGDKPLPYLNLPAEANPFLGYRAVRIYAEFEDLFTAQIRALLRASAFGQLKIMIPMIATFEEARWAKSIVERERVGRGVRQSPPVGAMIETPAAALSIDHLSAEMDFFSIGSNDLLQYVMAADRGSERLARLYRPLQPAFLRLLMRVIDSARRQGRSISLCGEMGGDIALLPLLAGSGLDTISAAIPAIPELKAELGSLNIDECRSFWEAATEARTAEEVASLLQQFASRHAAPLLDPELMLLNSDAATKEEAIKIAADTLFVMGRTGDPLAVEEAVWVRERTHSTGFGKGFAIPHCKTNAMRNPSLVVLRPNTPIEWDSVDGKPVGVMILMAVRESYSAVDHLKMLARVARLLADESFRSHVESEEDAESLCKFLAEAVNL